MVNVRLADVSIQLRNRYRDTAVLCCGYESKEPPQIFLSVSQQEIEKEQVSQMHGFTDGYLESICFYRKLALEMLRFDVFLLHASVLEVDGEGYAFLAPSGTGKTTQTRLWLEHFGSRARVINGDKPLIRMTADSHGWKFTAYGTPWCGKEGMGCNASVPLKALFLIERGAEPSCERALEEYSIDGIFRQLLMPECADQMEDLLAMVDTLVETVPCYRLQCDMTDDSVLAAYHACQ